MWTYKAWWRLVASVALAGCLGHPAMAATRTTSLGVSVTVVATCTMVLAAKAGVSPSSQTCQPASGGAQAIVAPPPLVKVARDPKSGAVVRIIEF